MDRRFASLDRDTKQIIRALLESKNAVKDEFETQSKSLLQFKERAHGKPAVFSLSRLKSVVAAMFSSVHCKHYALSR